MPPISRAQVAAKARADEAARAAAQSQPSSATNQVAAAGPKIPLFGRRMRVLNGLVAGRAYGNGTVTTDARGPSQIGGGRRSQSQHDDGYTSFRGLRYPQAQQPGPFPSGIGGPGGAYGGGWDDGIRTVRDRHVLARRGHARNTGGGGSSLPSPLKDGPPLAEYQMVNTSESWQAGTDHTTQEDNNAPHNVVPVTGQSWRRFPLGTQDGTATLVMGPPIGSWRTYGARGGAGMHGPEPDIIDPNWVSLTGAGGGGGRGRVVQAGAPGQQPHDRRLIYGGLPHGRHSPTIDAATLTMARQASIPQQRPVRQDRPASSRIAGQSYSQTIVPQSAAGRRVQRVPRTAPTPMPGPARFQRQG